MSLRPGTRLGVYEVTAKIGKGVMGEANGAETRAHVPLAASKKYQITSERRHVNVVAAVEYEPHLPMAVSGS